MKIIEIGLEQKMPEFSEGLVVALGFFDGIHIAHMDLINEVIAIGERENLKKGIITFHPNPNFVLNKNNEDDFLTPLEVRKKIFSKLDIDYLIIINFTLKIAKLKKKEFIQKLILPLKVKYLVAGFDNRYGSNGEGSIKTIFADSGGKIAPVKICERQFNGTKIGSTLIKSLLDEGKVKKVEILLNRPYSISGYVIHGKGLGKTVGVPTANLGLKYPFKLPTDGVYLVKVNLLEKTHYGICNIGHNPTFNYKHEVSIEVHIFDFEQDIYGEHLEIYFIDRIRDEVKFATLTELLNQIKSDIIKAKKLIKKINR